MFVSHYPADMVNEIKQLAQEYPITIEEAEQYYRKGGYEHAKTLIDVKMKLTASRLLRDSDLDGIIQMVSNNIWNKKNKRLVELMRT